jgi:hypothetical protein
VTSLDSPQFEQGATLSYDDHVMYFGQTDPTAGMEIMVAERPDAQAAFASPVPVTALNTMDDETPTWLSPDLCRLYFESARTGDFDLYVAERTP